MTTSRVPLLPVDEAKALPTKWAPDHTAELSISSALRIIRDQRDQRPGSPPCCGTGPWDSRLRELAIMRIGWLTDCDYE